MHLIRHCSALLISTVSLVLLSIGSDALATFSICAVDPATGEVGSAGASCIAGSIILSDVHPGVGVVHTQSYWNSQNQQYARELMNQGFSPQEILDLVVENDAQGNPTIRQYGAVDLVGGGRSASYTGVNCINWKGGITGPTYAVAGNILLGPEVIADMETAFLGTTGTLADRLMAALQAAKRPGADTRCSTKSAISAFLRIAQVGDPDNDLYLDLNVNNTSGSTDPIDVLQSQYDDWLETTDVPNDVDLDEPSADLLRVSTPTKGVLQIEFELESSQHIDISIFDVRGRRTQRLASGFFENGVHTRTWKPRAVAGVHFVRLTRAEGSATEKVVFVR